MDAKAGLDLGCVGGWGTGFHLGGYNSGKKPVRGFYGVLSGWGKAMKRDYLCHLAAATFALLIVTPTTLMLFDRRDPAVLQGGEIVPFDVKSGQSVTIVWNIIEHRRCGGEFTPFIIDSTKKMHIFARQAVTYRDTLAPEGHRFYKQLTIPAAVSPGPAIYTVRVERWCNPLQRYLWPIQSANPEIRFNVVE